MDRETAQSYFSKGAISIAPTVTIPKQSIVVTIVACASPDAQVML
jgi:hypothetical protein